MLGGNYMATSVGEIGECSTPRHVTGLDKDQARNDSGNSSANTLRTLVKDRGLHGKIRMRGKS